MRWLLTTVCLLVSVTPALAQDRLPAAPIDVPPAIVPDHGPWSFDLIDFREEERLARAHNAPKVDVNPHTFFIIKQHLGVAGGYDNGIAHGSVGYYVTVAEWGRWNFGIPAVEIGMGRYPAFDRLSQQAIMKDQLTFMLSITSAHYRVGYVKAWGVNCYLNLEQVFDLHANRTGSQFGLSFSRK
ncbi:MAG TPA: hypothetical protein VFI56_03410 [Vicinamibacterales bacterium]|jgi:hypothetical protein|nr:hypothetical protein [Vicinamibacterales bacterium]